MSGRVCPNSWLIQMAALGPSPLLWFCDCLLSSFDDHLHNMQCMFPVTLPLLILTCRILVFMIYQSSQSFLCHLCIFPVDSGQPIMGPQLPPKLHSLAPRLVWVQVTLLILAVQRRHLLVAHAPPHPLHVVWLGSFASQPCSVSAVGAATRHAAAEKAAALCLKLGGWGSTLPPVLILRF